LVLQTIGHYRVIGKLGEGGMGEVYLAEDPRLGRRIALKLLSTSVTTNAERVQRFEQEARAASALNHPNIITIHEVGAEGEHHFIATEYVEGSTLRQHMANSRMPLREVLETAIQVAGALSAAHAAGIVHRDIKPENIMLRPDGYVKVLDFGLAKLCDKSGEHEAADLEASTIALVNTNPGIVMGTVAYMSPEQVRGFAVDVRTDIWSLGAVLYEMLAGRLPFEGPTTSDVISLVLQKEPPALTLFSNEASDEVERIVTKALAKDREERYQTAKDLLIDLKRLKQRLDVEAELERTIPPEMRTTVTTVVARGSASREAASETARAQGADTAQLAAQRATSSEEYLLGEIERHRRRVFALVAALVLLVVTVSGAYFYYSSEGDAIDSVAVLPLANASGDPGAEWLSDGLTESIIYKLSQLPHLKVISRSSAFRYKGKQVDVQTVGSELQVRAVLIGRVAQRGDELLVSAELVDTRDNSLIWGEQYKRKISDMLAVQQDISREISERLRLRLTGEEQKLVMRNYTENTEAYQSYLRGRYYWNRRTQEDLQKSIEHFERAIEIDQDYALAYAGLADSYNVVSSYGGLAPRDAFPKAKAAAQRALEIDDTLAEAHTALGATLAHYDWDWKTAEQEFKRAVELNPNYAAAHYFYAYSFLIPTGHSAQAVEEMRRAQELEPLSLITNTNYAVALLYARRHDEAISQLQKSVEIDPNFAPIYARLADAYAEKGMFDEAIAEGLKARQLRERAITGSILASLGHAYAVAGKRREAERILAELKELQQRVYVSPFFIAKVHAGLGDKEQSIRWLQKALDERDYLLPRLKVEPSFEKFHSDPRFQEIVRRVNLAP
jgi:serine/threonine-protein kinase